MYLNAVFILHVALALVYVGFFAIILWKCFSGAIDLTKLVSEPDSGKASLSRFQMLLFTFVIAGLYLVLSIENAQFIDIPTNVLGLLGISGGSYIISKGMAKPGVGRADPVADTEPKKP